MKFSLAVKMKLAGRVFIILLFYLSLTQSFETSAFIGANNNHDLLVTCAHKLVKKYFYSGETLSGSVLAMSMTPAPPYLQSQIVQAFHLDEDISWSVIVRRTKHSSLKSSKSILYEKPQAYFMVIGSLDDEDMKEVFEDWKSMPNWNPLAQFVVLLSTIEESEDEMTEMMMDVMLMFMSKKMFNINVIGQTEEDGFVYSKTAFPYEPENNCGTRIITCKSLDICQFEDEAEMGSVEIKQQNRGLLLDKIPKDLSGCPLVAYSRSWEPYMFFEDGQVKGIEWMLVQTIAESLHIDINISIQNKTLYQIFQGLIDGKIDIVIGGIDEDPNLSQFVSASVPYLQDDLTWCVAKARKTLHWLNFVQVFSPETYAAYFGFIVVNAIAIYTIQESPCVLTKLNNDFFGLIFILIGIALNQSARAIKLHFSLRTCLMMALAAGVILGSTYNSFLVSSLTSPNTLPQIKRISQIVENKMAVTGSVEIIRHLNKDGDIFQYIRREFLMCYNMERCLQKAANDAQYAVAVSRQYSIHNSRIPKADLYCFDSEEHIYTYLVTMLMPKKFHLFHQINPIIQHIIESGHFLKWTRDLEQQRMLKAKQSSDDNRVMILEVSQILGILACTLIFLIISCFAFGLERLVYRTYNRGTRVKIVKMLHKNFSYTK